MHSCQIVSKKIKILDVFVNSKATFDNKMENSGKKKVFL